MEGAFPTSEAAGSWKDHWQYSSAAPSTGLIRRPFSSGCNDKAGNVALVTSLPVYEVG